ncbi:MULTISPECIES: hypothetical protein [Nostocales]|uniref:Uncharacterized protein n=3 Tax=Nostocales TaxID=1161 RepID=A0A0C1RKY7_9CYAN
MSEKSTKGYVYCFKNKQDNNKFCILRYTDISSPEKALEEIEKEYPKLKNTLRLSKKLQVPDINKAETWFENELSYLHQENVIERDFYDDQNHRLRRIKGLKVLAEEKISNLIKCYPSAQNSKSTKNSDSTNSAVLFIGMLLLLFFCSKNSDPQYQGCVDGGGGRACEKFNETSRDNEYYPSN